MVFSDDLILFGTATAAYGRAFFTANDGFRTGIKALHLQEVRNDLK